MHGKPVDYDAPAMCAECHVCVRRCPPGAITKNKLEYRGVLTASA